MFSADIYKKNLQKFFKKILPKIKETFLKLKIFFIELPFKLKQFSLLDFSKNISENYLRKIFLQIKNKFSVIIFKIKYSSREEKKQYVINTSKYIFSQKFLISQNFVTVVIFLLTLSSIYFYFSKYRFSEAASSDGWYNDSWSRRQKIVITNNSRNYSPISGYTGLATLAGNKLNNQGVLKNDCTDIRIVDTDGTLYDYWVDPETCTSAVSRIFFYIPDIYPESSITAYMYYGNPEATNVTIGQTQLFIETIPGLVANYNFDDVSNNKTLNQQDYTYSGIGYGASTFPEGYSGTAMYFDGVRQFISTPYTFTNNLSRAFTMIAAFKPEGTMATGYPVSGETVSKFLTFDDSFEATPNSVNCVTWENVIGDVVDCTYNTGVRQTTPPAASVKKVGLTNYTYDFNWPTITRPSKSISITGPNYYFYQNDPINILNVPYSNLDSSQFVSIKPYGSAAERRTIMAFGNTAAASFALDYSICEDQTISFSLDYLNSTSDANTLATGCLRYFQPSKKVSSIAAMSIAANSNHWVTVGTHNFGNYRYISINGALVVSDPYVIPNISNSGDPLYLGKASNTNKSNFYGEMDDWYTNGEGMGDLSGRYYTSGNLKIAPENFVTNFIKKPYVIFGSNNNNFYQAGFSNFAGDRYFTNTANPAFNYSYNPSNINDFYQEYGGNLDNTLNTYPSYISPTINMFNGNWTLFVNQYSSSAKSYVSTYIQGDSNVSYTHSYTRTNSTGNLLIGAYVNQNPNIATYPSEYFWGGIDDVYIYNKTLSSTQINYHSNPYNGYASANKTLWQADIGINLTSNGKSLITFSQNYPEEIKTPTTTKWYDEKYLVRTKVTFNSIPSITDPGLILTFSLDTSTPAQKFNMNSDCSGIVVADEYLRNLPYWIENCGTANSKFYVRMNPTSGTNYDIKGGSEQNIFVYYGNPLSTAKTYPTSQVFDLTIPGLQLAYSFNEAAATTTTIDLSGNGRTLQWVSRTQSSSGAFGSAPYFNGSSNYGSGPLPRATIASWSGISILGWSRLSAKVGSTSRCLYCQIPNTNHGFNYENAYVAPNYYHSVGIYSTNNAISGSASDWPDTNYHHSAYTWTYGAGNSMKLYYDGALEATLSNDSSNFLSFPGTQNGFTFGSYNKTTRFWTGAVDELRIFNTELSAAQISSYSTNTVIGDSMFNTSTNTCNKTDSWCMRSFVTPSLAGVELLGKYNANVTVTTLSEEKVQQPLDYWKFDEGVGGIYYDSVDGISSKLGDYRGDTRPTGQEPSWVPAEKCISNGCLYFDGLNDFASITTKPSISTYDRRLWFSTPFSYSFWMKPIEGPNTGSRYVISWGNVNATRNVFQIYLDSNNRVVRENINVASTASLASNSTLEYNKWYHITTTFDFDSLTESIYINGLLDTTKVYSAEVGANVEQGFFGVKLETNNPVTSTFYRGYLDEFKTFKKALTQSEVTNEYRKGLSGYFYKLSENPSNLSNFNLMSYYKFDEVSGGTGFNSADLNLDGGYTNSTLNNNQGLFNFAYSPPANSAYFSIASNTYTNQTETVAYSMWVKLDSSTNQDAVILNKDSGLYGGGFYLKYISSTTKFQGNLCGTTVDTTDTAPTGYWNHIVLESNSSRLRLFVNGKLQAEDTCINNYTGISGNTNAIEVGGDGTAGNSVTGLIDEFKIHNNYFSAYQVGLLFNYLPQYTGYGNYPISWYKLDYPANGRSQTASDSSGNANDLTISSINYTGPSNWIQNGKVGGAYLFSMAGTSAYIMSKPTTNFPTGVTRPYTFATWVKIPNANTTRQGTSLGNFMGVGNTNTAGAYVILGNNSNPSQILNLYSFNYNAAGNFLNFSSPYVFVSEGSTTTDSWHYVATTFDATLGYRKLYLDGELVSIDTGGANATKIWSISNSTIFLGNIWSINTGWQYYGYLDEAKFYDYPRTQEQIKLDMRNTSTAPAFNSGSFSTTLFGQKISIFRTNPATIAVPVVYFSFDQFFRSGGPTYYAFNGTSQNSVTNTNVTYSQNGKYGGAAYLTGNSSQLAMGDLANLNFGSGDFAMSFYINPSTNDNSTIAFASTNFVLEQKTQKIKVTLDSYTLTSNDSLNTNAWNHIFIQRNKDTRILEMYINGVFQGSNYPSGTYSINLATVSFKPNTANFNYYLDEARFYNNIFDEKSIKNIRMGGFGINIGAQGFNSIAASSSRSTNYKYCVSGDSNPCNYPAFEYTFNEPESSNTGYNSGTSIGFSDINLSTTNRVTGYSGRGTNVASFTTSTSDTTLEGALSFWLNADPSLTSGDLFSGKGITLNFNGTDFTFNSINYPSSNYTNSLIYIDDGKWHHVNINFNNGTASLYYDGVLLGTNTYTPGSATETWNAIGASIDEIRIYNYQRTPNQIAKEYSGNKPYVYLKFDECNSNIIYNSNLNLYRPLQGIQNGTRYDIPNYTNTGLIITRPSGLLNFGNCLNKSADSNWYLGRIGQTNSSFYFDGSTYMQGNDYHAYAINSLGYSTITFWVNVSTAPYQVADLIGAPSNSKGHTIDYSSGYIEVYKNTDGVNRTYLTDAIIDTKNWNHIALTTDGTYYRLYINGVLQNTSSGYQRISNSCTGNSPVNCSSNPFLVGNGFTGQMDELRIYNYPLTQQQIRLDMEQGAAVKIK